MERTKNQPIGIIALKAFFVGDGVNGEQLCARPTTTLGAGAPRLSPLARSCFLLLATALCIVGNSTNKKRTDSLIGPSYKKPKHAPNHHPSRTHDHAHPTPTDHDLYPTLGTHPCSHRSPLPALRTSTRLGARPPHLVPTLRDLSPLSAKKNEPPGGDSLLTHLYEMLSRVGFHIFELPGCRCSSGCRHHRFNPSSGFSYFRAAFSARSKNS